MLQVLFRLPIYTSWTPDGVPIYGFGVMLFCAFVLCTWLGGRRAERVGMSREVVQDLAIWLFIGGLLGARVCYMYVEEPRSSWPSSFGEFLVRLPRIWEGGIVFYGSVIGGLLAYGLLWWVSFKKRGISTLKLADVIAPTVALGLALGRIGCYLNGCCYGQVACADCPVYSVHFPLSAPARYALVESGVQTAAGFTVDDDRHSDDVKRAKVGKVDAAASNAGLKPGDVIEEADGLSVASAFDLTSYVGNFNKWPRGKSDLTLKVKDTKDEEKTLTIRPVTVGLHPTQLYETISMVLVMLLLMAYEPFKTRDGQVMVLMMLTYAVHRFVNEMLRNDPRPIGFERYASLFLFGAGLVMALWLRLRPAQYRPSWSVAAPA